MAASTERGERPRRNRGNRYIDIMMGLQGTEEEDKGVNLVNSSKEKHSKLSRGGRCTRRGGEDESEEGIRESFATNC